MTIDSLYNELKDLPPEEGVEIRLLDDDGQLYLDVEKVYYDPNDGVFVIEVAEQ